jgi:hypothetical protein
MRNAIATTLVLLASIAPAARAATPCASVPGNLVSDCSFEQPVLSPGADVSETPGSDIGGWTVSQGGDSVDFFEKTFGTQSPVADGNQAVDLNRDHPGGVEQTLATVRGAKYRFTVELSGVTPKKVPQCPGTEPQVLRVTAGATSQTYTFQPDDNATPGGNQRFEAHQMDFVAASNRTLLKLQGVNDGCTGPIVDDIVVTQTSKEKPVLGQAMVVAPTGTVLVRLPTSATFVKVTATAEFPVGTVIDATHGRVRLSATSGGKTYFADFYGGAFVIAQQAKKGATADLELFGGNFTGCAPAPRVSAAKNKVIRQLWGSGSGQFRTLGRYASATLRGTTWLTSDRCTGTLVTVTRGAVTVRDFVKRRNVVVRAGRQYFAAG